MARKTYSSTVEAYVDAELAAANDERSRAGSTRRQAVASDVSLTVVAALRASLGRWIRLYWWTALLAFLPALVIVARAGLSALPQLGVALDGWLPWAVQGITIAAAAWTALVALWQARNTWRRARGLPLVTLRFRRDRSAGERQQYQEYPSFMEVFIKLGVAVATLPALLWLALSGGGDQPWLLGTLVALRPLFLIVAVTLTSLLNSLGAVGGVDASAIEPLPSSEIAKLDDRIAQMQQIRVWRKDDKLKSMIDDVIGKQVARSARRQAAYSVTVGVLSLRVGWLLSAISPASTLAQFLPR
jgi:hypothetical protein